MISKQTLSLSASQTQPNSSVKKKMAAISSLMAPVTHHAPAAKPISLSFQFLRPTLQFSSSPLFLTSKLSRTRLFVASQDTPVAAQETSEAELEDMRRLYVGNLRYSIDSDDLRKIFEQVGAVEKAEVMYKKQYKKSRGFGFVTMKTVKDAEAAVEKLNGAEIKGFKLQVNVTTRPLSQVDSWRGPLEYVDGPYKVFVENLVKRMNARALKRHFDEMVDALGAKVAINPKSLKCAGFGYVTFSTEEERDKAVDIVHNTPLMGVKIRVTKLEDDVDYSS